MDRDLYEKGLLDLMSRGWKRHQAIVLMAGCGLVYDEADVAEAMEVCARERKT